MSLEDWIFNDIFKKRFLHFWQRKLCNVREENDLQL